jgi:hypothetical protein
MIQKYNTAGCGKTRNLLFLLLRYLAYCIFILLQIDKMTGPLAQIVTLSTFGNDFLYNDKLPEDFYKKNSAFQFCNKVDFRVLKKPFFFLKGKETVIADDPIAWFKYLKKDGCKRLRLYFQSSKDQSIAKDYKLAGLIGGGGVWLIEAIYNNHSTGWVNRWEVTKKDDPQHNILSVYYGMTIKSLPTIDLQIDQQKCKTELGETLTEIEEFAFQHDLTYWGEQFKNAGKALSSETPEESYYNKELIPLDRYSLISKQILFAAGIGWVFGAMGSWNDQYFEDRIEDDKYESLSETLYARVNQAIISEVNTY